MRNILLATDGSDHSLRGAQYVADLYKGATDVDVTILTISPTIPPIYREEAHDPLIQKQFAAWKKKREEEAEAYTDASRKVLLKAGFKRSRIESKYVKQLVGVARDITREIDAGRFDACVVGKKGLGWFGNMFLGSITDKLLQISEDHPIWLVEGKKRKSRKVLVAMDETRSTVELARYVGTMLKGLENLSILFYHYCAPFTENISPEERKKLKDLEKRAVEREQLEMSHFFEDSKTLLLSLGIAEESVTYEFQYDQSNRPKKVTQAILDKLKKGGYGTLVIGRKGSTHAREFRLGSVAGRTVNEARDCAIWVV
ncbi:MAG: universal stress protein [Deltaproteobacteria bacterium]|nr:universal stress protein [Deltaproteobacteria bacterium]